MDLAKAFDCTCVEHEILLQKLELLVHLTVLVQIFRILHKMAPSYLYKGYSSILLMLLVIMITTEIACIFHKCKLIMADNHYISEELTME